jgi:hypothetical protein
MSDFKKIVESDLQTFLKQKDSLDSPNWNPHLRNIDYNTDNYERNIIFLGCSITYGEGVENQDTYPSKVQQLSNNKWNCMNFGISGGSIDMAYLIYHKIKDLDIDTLVFQWPSFYRRAYFQDSVLIQYYPTITKDKFEYSEDFVNISDIDYCVMRNLSSIESINKFKQVYNLSPKIGHDKKEMFKKYGIENILDFNFYYETPKKYRIEDGHPNELWYKEYAEYLFEQIL